MARERNGSILMSKQVGCSSLSPLVNFSRYDWNLMMEERTWKIIAQKGLMDWRTTEGVVTTLEKSWPLHRNVWGGRNYDCWLGCAAKFLLSENSDKTPLTELAKNQAFPLFMAACGWRRPGFFTPSVTFENRASRSPDVFLAGWKKNCSRCVDISSYRERVMVMALYGRMHFAQRICCIQTFFFNTAKTWQAHVHTGCFFNCFSPFSKWQNVLCQRGDFIHLIFPKKK